MLQKTAKIFRRISKIRKGRLSNYGKNITTPHQLNESLAREFFARTIAVPMIKKSFKQKVSLIAVLGSSQFGVRLASRKRKSSDLDLLIVIPDSRTKDLTAKNWRKSPTLLKIVLIGKLMGIKVVPILCSESLFKANAEQTLRQNPIQVITGAAWIKKNVIPEAMEQNKLGKMEYLEKWGQWKDYSK